MGGSPHGTQHRRRGTADVDVPDFTIRFGRVGFSCGWDRGEGGITPPTLLPLTVGWGGGTAIGRREGNCQADKLVLQGCVLSLYLYAVFAVLIA